MQKPPQLPSITWRPLVASDAPALRDLDAACKQADGDEWVSNLVQDALSAASTGPGGTQCACLNGQIVAAGWVSQDLGKEGEQTFLLGGQVHPAYRRRGAGAALLGWAEQSALQQASPGRPIRLVIRSESLTPDAHAVYTRAGFTQVFVEQMMVHSLDQEAPVALFPQAIKVLPWTPQTTHGFYQTYADSFRDRPSFTNPSEAEWVESYADAFSGEGQFRPDLSMLAIYAGEPVGFLACEIHVKMGWISQMGVVPAWRGKGLGAALLAEALRRLRTAGLAEAGLHVNLNNPGAIRVYERLGFQTRLQRARYVKTLAADLLS